MNINKVVLSLVLLIIVMLLVFYLRGANIVISEESKVDMSAMFPEISDEESGFGIVKKIKDFLAAETPSNEEGFVGNRYYSVKPYKVKAFDTQTDNLLNLV